MVTPATGKNFKKVRLHKAAKELNLTVDAIVSHLNERGYTDALKGNGINSAIVNEEAYLDLVEHFSEDREIRARVQELHAIRESELSGRESPLGVGADVAVEPASSLHADVVSDSDWWLRLRVYRNKSLNCIYCFACRIGTSHEDDWTVRINNFKNGEQPDVTKAEKTLRAASPSLFECIGIDPETTIVIPVLESQETSATVHSKNSRLAKAIADGANAQFILDCLSKNQNPPLHRQRGLPERRKALIEADYKASKLDDKCESVVIVDDIVTSGMTMKFVATAIHLSNPWVQIIGFALGRHQRRENLPVSIEDANAEIPNALAEI